MILVKKASWSLWRFVGILIFYFSLTSLIGRYKGEVVGYFDIHTPLELFMGPTSSAFLFVVLFFTSIYLTLKISYRTILAKVRDSVPSFSSVRNAVLPDDYDDERAPTKKSKIDDAYKKKSEELEKKLALLQK
jgi:hypothetical protein